MTDKAVAVIHARGGSKRIPLKNIALVGGKPLLAYPIELCRRCRHIGRIIVSTDNDQIMDAAKEYGAEVPFRRPADISEDVPSELVTEHALKFLMEQGDRLPELVLTLTPATPFTRLERLDEGFELIRANPDWDAVTTIRPATEYPEWILRRDPETGLVTTVLGNPMDGEYNVSQNLPSAYYPTGAFWINRTDAFLKSPSMYGAKWGAVVVGADEGIDIDWPEELEKARRWSDKSTKETRHV